MTLANQELPRALGLDRETAVFRQRPEDFVVEESLGFDLTGDGEHLWLQVEKTALNTIDVIRSLAQITGVREQDIGYAGLKDRLAVATQWFSLAGVTEIDAGNMEQQGFRILQQVRNARKLRIGSHRGNHFVITLQAISSEGAAHEHWQEEIARRGVPNYFGPQRFGHGGRNLEKAAALFAGSLTRVSRHQRSMYLSAARSCLYNAVLAARVRGNTWDRCLDGDVMALEGSGSIFRSQAGDPRLAERLEAGDIHSTGPLWGKGDSGTDGEAKQLEDAIADEFADFAAGLVQAGMKQERRPLRVMPENLRISPAGAGQLVIEFSLPGGAYATSVVREMVDAPGL